MKHITIIMAILTLLAFNADAKEYEIPIEEQITEGEQHQEEESYSQDPHATIEGEVHPNDFKGKEAPEFDHVQLPPGVGEQGEKD